VYRKFHKNYNSLYMSPIGYCTSFIAVDQV